MKTVQAYIENKQAEFSNHKFFKLLDNFNTLEQLNYFVPELTFWAMTFQDVLRIVEEQITDPYLKKIARHHRLEDSGHEQWFLHDKDYMSGISEEKINKTHDVRWLYGKECRTTRDASYQIIAEAFNLEEEILGVILVLCLESTGHVFFDKVAEQAKLAGENSNLQYFSSSHLEVEKAHAIFENNMESHLFNTQLTEETRRNALRIVERCYKAFTQMFDGLVIACEKHMQKQKIGKVTNESSVAIRTH